MEESRDLTRTLITYCPLGKKAASWGRVGRKAMPRWMEPPGRPLLDQKENVAHAGPREHTSGLPGVCGPATVRDGSRREKKDSMGTRSTSSGIRRMIAIAMIVPMRLSLCCSLRRPPSRPRPSSTASRARSPSLQRELRRVCLGCHVRLGNQKDCLPLRLELQLVHRRRHLEWGLGRADPVPCYPQRLLPCTSWQRSRCITRRPVHSRVRSTSTTRGLRRPTW